MIEEKINQVLEKSKVGSLDIEVILKPSKIKDDPVKVINHKNIVNEKILFIDCDSKISGDKSYEGKELLKKGKKVLKKLVRENYTVSVPSNGSFILKNFGKILQLYHKTPNLITGVQELEQVKRKGYYRVKNLRLQGRIGKISESKELLIERVNQVISEYKDRISRVFIKNTQGPVVKI